MAETLVAYFTLGFSFVFCWGELVVYIYAMIINGKDYWSGISSDANIDDQEIVILSDDGIFEPGSASYDIYDVNNTLIQNQYGGVALGSSAPISIDFKRQTVTEFSSISRSLADQQVEDTITGNHGSLILILEVYRSFLSRNSELQNAMGLILLMKMGEAEQMIKRNSKNLILPRFSFASLLIEIYQPGFSFSYKHIMDKISKVKSTINLLSRVRDRDLLGQIITGTVLLDKLRTYRHYSTTDSGRTESPVLTRSETAFWKLWDLDLLCCKSEIQLFEGLIQLHYNFYLKSSV